MTRSPIDVHALPFWPDEVTSYDELFGSTLRGAVICAESEQDSPPLAAVASPAPDAVASPAHDAVASPAPEAPVHPGPGLLRLSTGEVVTLDRGVRLGRAPTAGDDRISRARPHLLRLVSPENDVSRNHAEVLLHGQQVMVRDLGSTNGTTVAPPGRPAMRLGPEELRVIEPGTVVVMAEEVSFTYESVDG